MREFFLPEHRASGREDGFTPGTAACSAYRGPRACAARAAGTVSGQRSAGHLCSGRPLPRAGLVWLVQETFCLPVQHPLASSRSPTSAFLGVPPALPLGVSALHDDRAHPSPHPAPQRRAPGLGGAGPHTWSPGAATGSSGLATREPTLPTDKMPRREGPGHQRPPQEGGSHRTRASNGVLGTPPNPRAACPKQVVMGVKQLSLPALFSAGPAVPAPEGARLGR